MSFFADTIKDEGSIDAKIGFVSGTLTDYQDGIQFYIRFKIGDVEHELSEIYDLEETTIGTMIYKRFKEQGK